VNHSPAILFITLPTFSVIFHKAKKSTADERRCTPIDPDTVIPVASVAAMGRQISTRHGTKSRRVRFKSSIGVHRRSSAVSEGFGGLSDLQDSSSPSVRLIR